MGLFDIKRVKLIIKNENFLVSISFLLISLIYLQKILLTGIDKVPSATDFGHYPTYAHIQMVSVSKYSQFPFWSNSHYMGYPLYADFSNTYFYPLSNPFFFLFGEVQGLKFILFVHVFLSGVGFWMYSKVLTTEKLPRYFGALMYMLCGAVAGRIGAGHLIFILPFPWIPITMYFLHMVIETRLFKYVIYSSLTFSIFILACVALFPYFSLLFLVFAGFQIIGYNNKSRLKIKLKKENFFILGIIVLLTSLLFAIKLIPVLNFVSIGPRPFDTLWGSAGFGDIISFFVSQSHGSTFPVGLSINEDFYYLGLIPLIFIPFSIFHSSPHKKYLIISSVGFILWAMGYFTFFGVIHTVSIFRNLSSPSRSLILATFCFISLAVLGFDWFSKKYKTLTSSQKRYVWLFFLGIMIISFSEMISPFIFYVFFPENYDVYQFFTQNQFTLATLIAAILIIILVSLIIAFVVFRLKLKDISGLIPSIKNPLKTTNVLILNKNTIFVFLTIFVVVNLFVVNSALFSTRPVWAHEEKLENKIVDAIALDDPEYRPWFDNNATRFAATKVIGYDNPVTIAYLGLWLRHSEYYYPHNITIGNKTYVPHIYEFSSDPDKVNSTAIATFTVINQTNIDADRGFREAEPRGLSDFFSTLGSEEEEDPPDNITLYLYRLNDILPDVFIIRDDEIIPLEVTRMTPHRIFAKAGEIRSNDIIVFKNTYYPGWKLSINNEAEMDTESYQRLTSYRATKDQKNATLVFSFQPEDFIIGSIISIMFFPAAIVIYVITKRRYLSFLRIK